MGAASLSRESSLLPCPPALSLANPEMAFADTRESERPKGGKAWPPGCSYIVLLLGENACVCADVHVCVCVCVRARVGSCVMCRSDVTIALGRDKSGHNRNEDDKMP